MTINSFVKQSIALILSLSLFAPFIAFAQTAPDATAATPVEVSVPADTAVPPTEETPSAETPSTDGVQDTAPTQEAVTGDALEKTSNPEDATSSESEIIPIVDATSTDPVPEEIPVVEGEAPQLAPDEIPVEAVNDLTIVGDAMTAVVQTVSEDFVPLKDSNEALDPDYVMALSGKIIPTEKAGVLGKSAITSPANVALDPVDGSLKVSGSCSNVYFVVLLFRDQTDYERDPASYIVNRAYPCVNGAYAYSINDLPTTIQNGTYYLLIGEQGDRGTWSPVTALTEVSINRSN